MHYFIAQLAADAATLLTAVTLAIAGWVLKNQFKMIADIRAIMTRVDDLPCNNRKKCYQMP